MTDKKPFNQAGSQAVMSLEGVFLYHYMQAIDRLQECWMGDGRFDSQRFEHQILFLIRLLPDRTRQEAIMKGWLVDAKEKYKTWGISQNQVTAFAGMEVVTEIIAFLCEAFELTHSDITGPATNKQYLKEAVAIQDMPKELVEKIQTPEPVKAPEEIPVVS